MGQLVIRWYGGACFLFSYHGWQYVVDPHTATECHLTLRAHEVLNSHVAAPGGAEVIPCDPPAGDRQVLVRRVLTRRHDREGDVHNDNIAHIGKAEGFTLIHLGALGHVPRKQKEELFRPDLLFLPVGGGDVLNADEAWETIRLLEPAQCIPMFFATQGDSRHRLVGEFLAKTPSDWHIRHLHSPQIVLSRSDIHTGTVLVPSLEKLL